MSVLRASRLLTSIVVVLIGGLGLWAAPRLSWLSDVVIALALAVAFTNLSARWWNPDPEVISFVGGRLLRGAVVCIGAGISLAALVDVGLVALVVIVVAITVAFAVAFLVGRSNGVDRHSTMLIAFGTAICGATAIASVAPLLKVTKAQVGLSLATIFTFNGVALLLYPLLGQMLSMAPEAYGMWVGVAVHDTSAAVAAGFARGELAGQVATVVKVSRTLFLIPLVAIAGGLDRGGRLSIATSLRTFPWFVVGMIALAGANSLGLLGEVGQALSNVGKTTVVFVVAGIGLTLRSGVIRVQERSLALAGLSAAAAVGAVALGLVILFGVGR